MVVVLRYHLDWSLDEIADAVGCATGTVKSRLHRALQRLESMLGAPA
jgi:DNA-directed RNA polymerase specialized sigma24 family protein